MSSLSSQDVSAFGNAVLSRYPLTPIRNHKLPGQTHERYEPRRMLECEAEVEGRIVSVFVTHLGLSQGDREPAIRFIAKRIGSLEGKAILLGDLNIRAEEEQGELRLLHEHLQDAVSEVGQPDIYTFRSDNPYTRLDYVLLSKDLTVTGAGAVMSRGSDHLPITADIVLNS